MRKICFLSFVLFLFIINSAQATVKLYLNDISNYNHDINDTLQKPRIFFVPVIAYAPETNVALGISGICSYQKPSSDTSYLQLTAIYTFNQQTILDAALRHYFHNNKNLLLANTLYKNFPEYFYGLGNMTPDSLSQLISTHSLRVNIEWYQQIKSYWYVGGVINMLDYFSIHANDPNKISLPELGNNGGYTLGVGASILHDNRDNAFNATKGWYLCANVVSFNQQLGSAYNFVKSNVDARYYFRTNSKTVLAGQLLYQGNSGNVPFWQTAALGGSNMMRGLYAGRYRDNYLLAAQSEWRYQFSKKWGFTTFAALGKVANTMNELDVHNVHASYGIGFRRRITKNNKINIRIDVARSGSATNFYVNLAEAF